MKYAGNLLLMWLLSKLSEIIVIVDKVVTAKATSDRLHRMSPFYRRSEKNRYRRRIRAKATGVQRLVSERMSVVVVTVASPGEGDGGDDKKAPSCRNETRLEYSSRFCAAISAGHLSLAARPPLNDEERERDDRLSARSRSLPMGPIIVAAADSANGTFFFSSQHSR